MSKLKLNSSHFLLIMGVIILCGLNIAMSLNISEGGDIMDTGGIVALCIAILTLAGTIWRETINTKRTADKVGEVKSDVGYVKTDTVEMKPRVENIDKNTDKIKDAIFDKVVPHVASGEKNTASIAMLVNELEYQKRLKSEISLAVHSKDYFLSGIDKLYEENAKLTYQLKEQKIENQKLSIENIKLKDQLHSLDYADSNEENDWEVEY